MVERIKVIAYGMHEDEINAAERIIQNAQPTDAFVCGDIDETRIPELEAAGLIVERIPEKGTPGWQPETPGTGARISPSAPLRSTAFTTHRVRVDEELPDPNRANVYLIEIAGPLLEQYRSRLRDLGAELMKGYGANSYSAYLRGDQVAQIRSLDFVEDVQLYTGPMSAPHARPDVALAATAPDSGRSMVTWDIRVHSEEGLNGVRNWCANNNIPVAGYGKRKLRVYLLDNSPLISRIANLPEVQGIEEYVPPRVLNDRASELLKVNPGIGASGFDGANQIIGIADTGIDDTHPDLQGVIIQAFARGRPGRHDDPNGHGTHVAGSAVGRGTASNGVFKGVAPAAQIVVQSLLDRAGGLGGLPVDLGDLLHEAYNSGVRIHNNSWGAATASTYTMNSSEVDEYVWAHPDLLVVFAAGNEGQAYDPQNTPQGVVDWLSINSPATSKNALTVGASRSDRANGGLSSMTWGAAWPENFPPPIGDEKISGNPESIAAFSSRGPSDDRRIKPDVVAPGTDIVSARSKTAPVGKFWDLHTNPKYAYLGGTSQATPLVSGCAALVRQYYEQKHNYNKPSAALLRATLINGTRWLSGADSLFSNRAIANYDQGFGCVDMATTIPNEQNGSSLSYVDSWTARQMALGNTGDVRRWLITLSQRGDLRVCLAYTDYPGRAVQNNLNLLVQAPDRRKLIGNQGIRQDLRGIDRDNNVEVIRIKDAAPGSYWVQITASNLLHPPQEFALVVTGPLSGGLVAA